jgi:hypothetical protein
MRRGRLLVVVGGLVIVGVAAFSFPQWWPQARELVNNQHNTTLHRPPGDGRVPLEQRVREYWQARVDGNKDLSFQYEHPDQQERLGREKYKRRIDSSIRIKQFSVLKVSSDPDNEEIATVRLGATYTYDFRIPGAKPITVPTHLTDYWQKEGEVWYHVIDFKVIPDGRPVIAKKAAPAS